MKIYPALSSRKFHGDCEFFLPIGQNVRKLTRFDIVIKKESSGLPVA